MTDPVRYANRVTLVKYLLLPVSWLYGVAMVFRNKAFDFGLLESKDVGVPVISIGNMTMGGTGKTPLVEHIVEECLSKEKRVAVVSRGYKRESKGIVVVSDGQRIFVDAMLGGDEPVQIARKYPHAIVVVGERRVDAALKAVDELKADVVVLDDGFQHRYLKRTLDIVVVDASKNIFALPMIPAGERREPVNGMARADLIAFSRVDEASKDKEWPRWLSNKFRVPKISYRYKLDRIRQAGSDRDLSARDLKGKRMVLFSGIGDHQAFVRQMSSAGVDFSHDLKFPDHHTYTNDDLQLIVKRVIQNDADGAFTTEKDFVRLSSNKALFNDFTKRCGLFYASVAVDIVEGHEILGRMLEKCLSGETAR